MKIKIYRTNKKVLVSPHVLNLNPEVAKWKILNKILRARINANSV